MMTNAIGRSVFDTDDEACRVRVVDPVCGMALAMDKVVAHEELDGWAYFFCSESCRTAFALNRSRFVRAGPRGRR